MDGREKIENRKRWTSVEKLFMLQKSKSRCCHCGKELSLSTMTVEHVIPISKGGTNDMENMVALCETCNAEKDDLVVNPIDFYKFINKDYMEELVEKQNNYYNEVRWVSRKNFLPEDIQSIVVEVPINQPKSGAKSRVKNGKRVVQMATYKKTLCIKRAVYSDLDEIYNLTLDYYSRHESLKGYSKEYCKNMISEVFNDACFYIVTNSDNKILAAFPISIMVGKEDDKYMAYFHFSGFVTTEGYHRESIIVSVLHNIICAMGDLNFGGDNLVVFVLSLLKDDKDAMFVGDTIDRKSPVPPSIISNSDSAFISKLYVAQSKEAEEVDDIDEAIKKFTEAIIKRLKITEENIVDYNEDKDEVAFKKHMQDLGITDDLFDRSLESYKLLSGALEENEDGCKKVISIDIDTVIVPPNMKAKNGVSSLIKKQIKTGSVKPIKVNTKLELVEGIDIYMAVKSYGCKKINAVATRKEVKAKYWETPADNVKLLAKRQNNACYICNRRFNTTSIIANKALKVPIYRGGSNTEENCIAVCEECRDFMGKLPYSDALKELILEEMRYKKFI